MTLNVKTRHLKNYDLSIRVEIVTKSVKGKCTE